MKKVIIWVLIASMSAAVFIGYATQEPPADNGTQTNASTEAKTEATTGVDTEEVEPQTEETTASQGGIGGSFSDSIMRYKYRRDLYSIPYELSVFADGDGDMEKGSQILAEWLDEEFNASNNKGNWKKSVTVLDVIKKYNISKEDFIAAVEHREWYTSEEIDVLYSDDYALFRRTFVSPCAFLVGDTIYTPEMIYGLSLDEIKALGITEADITEKMSSWGYELANTAFYSSMVALCKANDIEYEEFEWSDKVITATEEPYATWLPETEEVYFTTELPTQTEQPTEAASASE